jgi:uncharacterized membrane protein YgcG
LRQADQLSSPIEIILCARKRIARLAVTRTLLHAALPLSVTLAMAVGFNSINELVFNHFGYLMNAGPARLFQFSLLVLTLVGLVAAALLGWRVRSYASDFTRTAERIDQRVGGRQEIITLASLSDRGHPEAAEMRSALFPILWERVSASLETFDPRSAFTLELRKPLGRSLILAAVAFIASSAMAFALMTRPTPAQLVTRRLQLFANTIGVVAPIPAQKELAAAVRDVAKDLINPKLAQREKIAELRALERELQKFQAQRSTARTGRGNSSGNGTGSSSGEGEGRGSGSLNGSGSSPSGGGAGNAGKANQQMIELSNDIAKAQMRLAQEADSGKQTTTAQNDSSQGTEAAPKPGSNPHQPGGQNSAPGNGQVPRPQTLASATMPSGQSGGARRGDRGSMGDTHLGEFPKPGNYQRYYQLGEHGATIDSHDARYVTFKLPTAIESAGAGAMVSDATRPQATTPYTNAPLKPQRLPASPDEQQLVPPRYRTLIR